MFWGHELDLIIKINVVVGVLFAAILGGIRVFTRAYEFSKKINSALSLIETELRPNGGSSIKDIINKIHKRQIKLEESQRTVLNTMSLGIWEFDVEGNVIWANQALLKIMGASFDDTKGFGWLNSLCLMFRDGIQDDWALALKQQRIFKAEYCFVSPEGVHRPVDVEIDPLKGATGEVVGYLGVVYPKNKPCKWEHL